MPFRACDILENMQATAKQRQNNRNLQNKDKQTTTKEN